MLEHGLCEVLQQQGPVFLKDPKSGRWNFPEYLSNIPSISEFDFARVAPYRTASNDPVYLDLI